MLKNSNEKSWKDDRDNVRMKRVSGMQVLEKKRSGHQKVVVVYSNGLVQAVSISPVMDKASSKRLHWVRDPFVWSAYLEWRQAQTA